ncbi:MAG: flagellar filament capping protein FliD [Lachnospiraceae bacterium]|nr:flagellar filament capping protein FliD [Lachnospiraceae bacterium]
MPIRITGMNSGLDTEAIITQLASARSVKVQSLKKAQIKLSWKQDAWKALNTKIYSFYTDTLNDMKYQYSYAKKATTVSDSTKASVTTGDTAVNGTQSLNILSLAKAGYMTGAKLSGNNTSKTTMADLGITENSSFTVTAGDGTTKDISITGASTIADVVSQLKSAGVNANFDEKQQRFYISSTATGADNDFNITASDVNGTNALSKLGLDVNASDCNKIDGTNAKITLNGVNYESDNNVFEINGLTISATAVTGAGEENAITINTDDDYSGIYDMVKNFITKYNSLINEMSSLYNADSAAGYDPLLSEEKADLSDSEIEDWEEKIKDALLRKDSTLSTITTAMTGIMASGVSVTQSDGTSKTMYLSDFGINALSYFSAAENERNAYHIDGDSEDSSTKANTEKLMNMIKTDPDSVTNFFTGLTKSLYDKMTELMAHTDYSSAYTVYEDRLMQSEYCDYNSKISAAEEKLNNYIDKWYSKFSTMETALSKINSQSSSLSNLLGQ